MAHNQMTVFILENLLLFISHLLQRHTDRRRWLSPLSFSVSRTLSLFLCVVLLLSVCFFSWDQISKQFPLKYSVYRGSCRATASLCAHQAQKSSAIPRWRFFLLLLLFFFKLKGLTGLRSLSLIDQDAVKKGWTCPKGISDPLLSSFSLLQFFFLSFLFLFSVRMHRKRREIHSCGGSVILCSVGHYLPILIFAGVRRQTLALPQHSLSLLFLSLSPPPSVLVHPVSIWWMGGCSPQWALSALGGI